MQSTAKTIEQGLRTGQIGTPVAARVFAHQIADHGHIEAAALDALAITKDWFRDAPDQLTAFGSVESGQITILARFPGGQSALVSAGVRGVGQPLAVAHVWGNRGMLCFTDRGSSHDGSLTIGESDDATSRTDPVLLGQLRSALVRPHDESGRRQASQSQRTARPQPPPYGVLLVAGDSTHQPGYAETLATDPRCRLIGLTDEEDVDERRKGLNEQLAERLGIPVFPDLPEAVNRDDVHIVSVCAEPYRRGRIAVLAADAGKHLYLDKPLAGSIADADAIRSAVTRSGVVAHMFSLVHSDAAIRSRCEIESGELGDLTAVHLDVTFAKGIAGTARLGGRRVEAAIPEQFERIESKREFTNVGVYPVVQLLTQQHGPARSVCAATGNYFFEEHQRDDFEDFGQLLVEFESGVIASVSAGRTGWLSHPGGGMNRTWLVGRKTCTLIDAHDPRAEIWADVAPWRPPDRNPDDPMGMWATPPGSQFVIAPREAWLTPPSNPVAADVTHFLDCIEKGRTSLVSADVAAAATEILMAGYRSAATGEIVSLPLPR